MATFDKDKAIARFTELSRLIQVGAYDERDIDGSYGEDGIEKAVDELELQAHRRGLDFSWHKDSDTYTLEPMSAENKAAFLEANVDQLTRLLAETLRYLSTFPYESGLEQSARMGLHTRGKEVLERSYIVPLHLAEWEAV
jgi:hypothetical protein